MIPSPILQRGYRQTLLHDFSLFFYQEMIKILQLVKRINSLKLQPHLFPFTPLFRQAKSLHGPLTLLIFHLECLDPTFSTFYSAGLQLLSKNIPPPSNPFPSGKINTNRFALLNTTGIYLPHCCGAGAYSSFLLLPKSFWTPSNSPSGKSLLLLLRVRTYLSLRI